MSSLRSIANIVPQRFIYDLPEWPLSQSTLNVFKNTLMGAATPLEILFHDQHLVAVNKPCGYLVHRSAIARDAEHIILQQLRDQIEQHIFPVHRLDRKTSGVLIFALDQAVAKALAGQFADRTVSKNYTAIVRGWPEDEGRIDHALMSESGRWQDAVTDYQVKRKYELPIAYGRYDTSRYAELSLVPQTGRMHQLRKHMNHIRHPILGDRPHGCSKQNKLWKDRFGLHEMMLHALTLTFSHPVSGDETTVSAPYFDEYKRIKAILGQGRCSAGS